MSLPFDASATAPSGEPDTKALAAAVNEDFARATAAELAAATFVFGELTRLVDISFTRSHQVFLWGMANGEPDAATGLLIVLVRDDAMNVLKSITFGAVRSDGDFTGVRFPELEQAKNADPAGGISFFALLGIGTTWEDLAPDPLSLILLGLGTGTVGLLICGRQWQRERRYYRRRYHQLVR